MVSPSAQGGALGFLEEETSYQMSRWIWHFKGFFPPSPFPLFLIGDAGIASRS